MLERRGVDERLERGSGLPAAARRAVERAARVVGAADHREDVAGGRIDRDERRLEPRAAQPREPGGDRLLRCVLHRGQKRRVHLPVGRVVAAEFVAELLPQEFLRPAGARVVRLAVRLDARPHPARGVLLRAGDQPLVAHLREHDVAALERAVVVGPRRQRRRRANQAGDERRLRQRHLARGLSKQMLRHGLDAVHARAQIHAVQVELQDLLLRQLRFDEEREPRFLQLAAVAPDVREKERPRELLCERAAAFHAAAMPHVLDDGARDADRIDAGMAIETPILDGDDGVLQIERDVVERHVVPLLVEAEPRLAVGAVEDRVADAACQPVDGDGVARQPHRRDAGGRDERQQQRERDPLGPSPRPEQVQERSPLFSVIIEYPSAIAKITTMSPSESHFGISRAIYPALCRYSTRSLKPTHAMMMKAPSTSAG